ncbi:alpha-glucosidase [Bacteroidota bacterium]|nr:alpha-glucosidase [Bacteroidota bacterium]
MNKNLKRQDPGLETIGVVQSFNTIATGYLFHCENATVKVELFNAHTIRVNAIRNNKSFEDFSYAITTPPSKTEHQFFESNEQYVIQTEKIKVLISKFPLRIQFLTLQGQIIHQEHPSFGTGWFGNEVASYKSIQPNEIFVGLGEKTGNLNRRGSSYTHWNTDYFGYPTNGDPLYLSTPFYIGIHRALCYGVFYDNTYKSIMDFGASNDRFTTFTASDGEMDYYFFYDDNIAGILKHYTALTGRVQLPPLWSLGFQQCRYSYYPDKEVINVARTFREKDIPADVIYLDIHYMDEYKVFTWHPERFPNPNDMVDELHRLGFHVILIVDPGVKVEEGYPYYEEGIKKDLFLKYPDGELYSGKVWPGTCHFPDFTNPEARKWWGQKYKIHIDNGIEGYWNDMNEPATWGKRVPDVVEFNYEGIGASHRKGHNVYGMQMARSTYEGTKELLEGKRPFVLTRSGYSGVQRYAAVWTGDNTASDEHMMCGIRLISSMGLAGVAFAGYDVGGFAGEPSNELFARWIAIGAFSPFFRCHSMINSRDAEPWAFGEEVEEISRNYIKLRYRMLPYIYSIFYEASQTGMPIQRSLVIDYMNDTNIYNNNYQNEYLFGPSILIAPVPSTQMISKIYLPEGGWYDFFTDKYYEGGKEILIETGKDKIPIFVKQGAIVPIQRAVSQANGDPGDTLEIHIYKGIRNESFVYYEDDGAGFDYEDGMYYRREILFNPKNKSLTLKTKEGNYHSKFKKSRVFFHGYNEKELHPKIAGIELDIIATDYRFVAPVTDFDPWHYSTDNSKIIKDRYYTKIELEDAKFV